MSNQQSGKQAGERIDVKKDRGTLEGRPSYQQHVSTGNSHSSDKRQEEIVQAPNSCLSDADVQQLAPLPATNAPCLVAREKNAGPILDGGWGLCIVN